MEDPNRLGASGRIAGLSRRSALRRLGAGGIAASLIAGFAQQSVSAQTSLSAAATEAAPPIKSPPSR